MEKRASFAAETFSPEYLKLTDGLAARHKVRSYELMEIRPGHAVLDVGCGSGADISRLAQMQSGNGLSVGLDNDTNLLHGANNLKRGVSFGRHIGHVCGDAQDLPFRSNRFDSCRTERLLQNANTPERVLSEMLRVTRNGGTVVALDTDWNTLSIDTTEVETGQKLKEYLITRYHKNGFEACQLYRFFGNLGLKDIHVEVCPLFVTDQVLARESLLLDDIEERACSDGLIGRAELDRWRDSLSRETFFFATVALVLVRGRKV